MSEERKKRLEEFCRQWDMRSRKKLLEGRVLPKKEIFERMAWELSRVPFEEVFIDIGCNMRMIDFNIATGVEGFEFSCAIYEEVWDEKGDECYTAVGRNHNTISMNIIDLEEFVDKVLEVIDELRDLKEKFDVGLIEDKFEQKSEE